MRQLRYLSTKIKATVQLCPKLQYDLESNKLKVGHHPGIIKPRVVEVPKKFIEAVINVAKDYPTKKIVVDSHKLVNKLKDRLPPMTIDDIKEKKKECENRILGELPDDFPEDEKADLIEKNHQALMKTLKSVVYNWQPNEYNEYKALQYLFGRSAAEYAVLNRIFAEISARDPLFTPKTFFDFGSGIGTGIWAAKEYWNKSIYEYFCVDSSASMNELALSLLKLGVGNRTPIVRGVFFRQFLPTKPTEYDLVITAYTLFELPSMKTRLQTILNLWNKTKQYLVIVEYGSNSGFKLVNEARDYILSIKDPENIGHVFAPCPHDQACPRYAENDGRPCNFLIKYWTMAIGSVSKFQTEQFSYVVLKKGEKDYNDPSSNWSRLVSPTLVRSRHSRCRMCGTNGQLEEIVFTKSKHGKFVYQCARATNVGDLLPMNIKFPNEQIISSDNTNNCNSDSDSNPNIDPDSDDDNHNDNDANNVDYINSINYSN